VYLTNNKDGFSFVGELKKGTVIWKIVLNNRRFGWGRKEKCEFFKRKLFLSEDEQRVCWVDAEF
jgi:hypothetical protein